MKKFVWLLSAALVIQSGCSKKEEPVAAGDSNKRAAVSIDGAADAPKDAQPAASEAPPPPAPAAPDAEAAAPAASPAETLEGETALSDWSYALQDYHYRTKRFPKDIAELAISVHKPVPRPPPGYKISIDKENQRVVLLKGN